MVLDRLQAFNEPGAFVDCTDSLNRKTELVQQKATGHICVLIPSCPSLIAAPDKQARHDDDSSAHALLSVLWMEQE